MPLLEVWIGGIMLAALILYVLSGGADFGGGVWDLFATGTRATAQRELIAHALAPIWEAHHVWLIVVIVIFFTAFPTAFATMTTILHIPFVLMLIGIVLRGSAFAFRAYGIQSGRGQRRWSLLFAISSLITPIMLGVIAGAMASGTIPTHQEGEPALSDFFTPWLAPFPLAIGFFTLTLCAFLAAVYLILETDDPRLQDDFRCRALYSALAVGVLAWISFLLAGTGAPLIRHGLSERGWSIPFHLCTGLVALGALWALWKRRFHLARILAILQVTLIILGWGLAQFPYLIAPDLTLQNSAAPASVLRPLLIILIAGAFVLAPSFWYLYAVFKGRTRPGQTRSRARR
ncbi:MAG: cytochrome d ubiquinol oxidase subunit II [Nitrospinota bacterium]|nr:MAG: cytochrome d ubiquinol oxidase subunit II [Nitrospinota bacterium]